jgi:2',3'-cyclic-nucleotide 2'-phosphodiesterase/3'-nucleotidase
MKNVVPDAETVAVVAAGHDAAMRALAEELAVLEAPVSARGARFRDTGLLDWLHAVQLSAGKAQLSFCSLLPAQLPDWPAGPLTLRQVWAFYPYENSLVTVEATGRQVRVALERSAGCVARLSELGRNCDTLAGAEYALDLSRPEGRRVVYVRRNGRDVADADVFAVAINSYRASGGGGYSMWKAVRRVSEYGNIRDLLAADARARKRMLLEADGNWKVEGKP